MPPDSSQPEPAPESAQLDEQLVAYLDGELDEETARRVETLAADDPRLRDRLAQLGRAWDLLDALERPETEEAFTETTLELVAVQAEQEARRREARRPVQRWLRATLVGGGLLAAGLAGFLVVSELRGDPDGALIQNLPVVENVDDYLQITGDDDRVDDSVDFLRRLHQERLFTDDDAAGEDDHAP